MSTSAALDPRVHAFRPDLADVALRGVVAASRYVEPTPRQCVRGVVPLLAQPRADSVWVSEIRYGEFLDVLEERDDGFAWVQNRTDRYVGYIPLAGALSEAISALSTRVTALHTFVYPDPDFKAPPRDRLTLGSYVGATRIVNGFAELSGGGYVFTRHLAPSADSCVADYVFTAGRLLGTPYLWGGRTPLGIDCSGLVQLALDVAGIEAPRDSDQQAALYGQPLPAHWRDVVWRRGDLVFFPGHVGIMTSHDHILHASSASMLVMAEPLEGVVERGAEPLAMARFDAG